MWLSSMTMHGTLLEDTFEKKYIHLDFLKMKHFPGAL